MKILVINLDRSAVRMNWMAKILSEQDLSFERIAAVDSQDIPESKIHDYLSRSVLVTSRGPNAGDVGGFLSHRKCWELAAQSDDGYVCILEDDIHLSKDAGKFLKSTEWIPGDADIVKIETFCQETTYYRSESLVALDRRVAPLSTIHLGAAGYIIHRSAAKRLLELSKDRFLTVDWMLFDSRLGFLEKLKVFQLIPALCIQNMFLPENLQNPELRSVSRPPGPGMVSELPPSVYRAPGKSLPPVKRFRHGLKKGFYRLFASRVVGEIPFR
jgi:glycosyl transferase family 25